jgi:glucose/arabinose dehydrogenase
VLRRLAIAGILLAGTFASVQNVRETSATVPINFIRGTVSGAGFTTSLPTAVEVGPDGRLYVADQNGRIQALTLNASKQVTATQQLATNAQLQEVFGITFDPDDASSPSPLYVSNTVSGFGDASPAPASGQPGSYAGKITKIHGTGYATRTDIMTGLPVSNSGHEANGLQFGPDGRLYIAQGGTTNAGIINPGGGLFQREEVPTGGAILVADVNAGGFDGNITYSPPDVYSSSVDQTGGDVSVFASGFRNPYGLVWHSNGRLYATDNGPNAGYGPPSTSCNTQGSTDASEYDELDLVQAGKYYGHPNRNRGLAGDTRQCTYHANTEPSTADYQAPLLANMPASSDGMAEYTSNKFGGQMQGDLLYAAWVDSELHRIRLGPGGTSVIEDLVLATGLANALDVAVDADGTIYVAEYGASRITYFLPDETPVSSISVTGITPNAGPIGGGQDVVITGTNFTTTSETTVTIGGTAATNVVVQNSTTIEARTPAHAAGVVDVVVTNANPLMSGTLAGGYTYVEGGGTTPPVADAGPDVSSPIAHDIHAHITLDGRASFDPDGFIVSYEWKEGTTVLSTNSVDSVQFTEGTHTVELTVTDNDGYTDTDDVRVIVTANAENPIVFYCFDVNGDTAVNSGDLLLVAQQFGKSYGQAGFTRLRDYNMDHVINSGDLLGTASWYTNQCPLVDQQIRAATAGMEQYENINNATAAGFFQVTPYIPGMGRHMMRLGGGGAGLGGHDTVFEPGNPEALLYEPHTGSVGGWRLGGAMYIIPYELTTNPPGGNSGGIPPDAFATNDDAWHYHNWLCIWNNFTSVAENVPQSDCMSRPGNPVWQDKAGWLLHLWNFRPNPEGRFVEISADF